MNAWQDISTAPKDGTSVLIYSPDAAEPKIIQATFLEFEGNPDPGEWFDTWIKGGTAIDADPTHWQPLPQPPEAARRLRKAYLTGEPIDAWSAA